MRQVLDQSFEELMCGVAGFFLALPLRQIPIRQIDKGNIHQLKFGPFALYPERVMAKN